jgi:hypothetical protein
VTSADAIGANPIAAAETATASTQLLCGFISFLLFG